MNKSHDQLKGEIRYAIRLCQRTARFYRRIQTGGVFLAIIGGSATMATLFNSLPHWIAATGAITLSLSGAALIAIRPADKAAQNELDIRRYQSLMTKAISLNTEQLEIAIEEAHQGDAPELESFRCIAYNDVMQEINRMDCAIQLTPWQRILSTLA